MTEKCYSVPIYKHFTRSKWNISTSCREVIGFGCRTVIRTAEQRGSLENAVRKSRQDGLRSSDHVYSPEKEKSSASPATRFRVPEAIQEPDRSNSNSLMLQLVTNNIETDIESALSDEEAISWMRR